MNPPDFCVICQENIDTQGVSLPGCNHSFHSNCIVPWLQKNNECPVCRYEPASSSSSESSDDEEYVDYVESVIRSIRKRHISTGFRILRSANLSRHQRLVKTRYENSQRDLQNAKHNIQEINTHLRQFKKTSGYLLVQNELNCIQKNLRKAKTIRNRCLRKIQYERSQIEQIGRDAN